MILLENLEVFKLAEQLSDLIWNQFDHWPEKVKRTIGYQILRASDSISANIAEGYGRFTPKDSLLFYRYARGSFYETESWVKKLSRRNVINDNESEKLNQIISELGPKLNGFIRSTKTYRSNTK